MVRVVCLLCLGCVVCVCVLVVFVCLNARLLFAFGYLGVVAFGFVCFLLCGLFVVIWFMGFECLIVDVLCIFVIVELLMIYMMFCWVCCMLCLLVIALIVTLCYSVLAAWRL